MICYIKNLVLEYYLYFKYNTTSKPDTSSKSITKIKEYTVLNKIGSGHYGSVYKATKNTLPFVLKKINRLDTHFKNNELKCLTKINQSTRHNNIIRFYEQFIHNNIYYYVFEFCEGIELFDYIQLYNKLTENQSKHIIKVLFSCVAHLHSIFIIHRDIKPENIMIQYDPLNLDRIQDIKLIDFGLSKLSTDDIYIRMTTKVGTPYYMSPEVLDKNYNYLCDEWSVGVILYVLLCGYPPFNGENDKAILNSIREKKLIFINEDWKLYKKSPVIKLIKQLITSESRRIKAVNALKHQWFA